MLGECRAHPSEVAVSETYIVEGRIVEVRREGGQVSLAVDVDRVLRRAWPPQPIEAWATTLIRPIGGEPPTFHGPGTLVSPAVASGQRVRLVAKADGEQNHLIELAVLSQVTRRFTFPRVDASVSVLAPRVIGVAARKRTVV